MRRIDVESAAIPSGLVDRPRVSPRARRLAAAAGIDPASVASVEAVLLDPGGDAAATRQLRQGNGGWVLPLSGASNASQVRISVNAGATTVADFPLHAGAADR